MTDLTRDFGKDSGDSIEIVLDTFHDERNGYQFATNPAGAKWDAQMVNEGRETNESWDGVWYVETRVVEDGWVAEFAIPFKTLKFREHDVQTWGINFQRNVRRKNEDSFWSPLPRIYSVNRVSLTGTLDDLEGINPGANFRVKPYDDIIHAAQDSIITIGSQHRPIGGEVRPIMPIFAVPVFAVFVIILSLISFL